jgi:cytochrome c-type biogenesis protein CcmF
VLNNLFLTTAAATVLVGTLYPLILEAVSSDKISVGAPFFNMTFAPLMVPLLAVVPFGPLLAWKRGDLYGAAQRLFVAFGGAILAVLAMLLLVDGASVLAVLGAGLATWLVLGALTDIAMKSALGSVPLSVSLRRFAGLPRSVFGTALAHLGLGLTLLGIASTLSLQIERITSVKPGETIELSGYTLHFNGITRFDGPNYDEDQAHFALSRNGRALGEVMSSKRFYPVRQMPTTESGIRTFGFSQLYVSLGDKAADGSVVVRVWWKPLVTLIWLGGLVMMAGAAVSLMDRRLRVGAPARRRTIAAKAGVPAE